jgi:hypothetical protein
VSITTTVVLQNHPRFALGLVESDDERKAREASTWGVSTVGATLYSAIIVNPELDDTRQYYGKLGVENIMPDVRYAHK